MHKVTNWKWALSLAAGCWMVGEGARMVVMGLFFQGHYYQPNLFDVFFDWVPLTIIGTYFFIHSIRNYYVQKAGEGPSRSHGPKGAMFNFRVKHI